MKTFLIFVDTVDRSISHASIVLGSIKEHCGWDVEILPGTTPHTLKLFETQWPLEMQPRSRVQGFRREKFDTYLTKKSCFYNHYRVWHRCVELNRPVAFVEHDAVCVCDWDYQHFNDVLILHPQSAVRQRDVQNNFSKYSGHTKFRVNPGVNTWDLPVYNRHTEDSAWPIMMPGTAAYAIQPQAAQRLIKHAQTYGWEQSDHFINTHIVDIQYRSPDYFKLALENLQLSHGINQTK